MPARLTRPNVGFRPTIPQHEAGQRIEPPVSVPGASGRMPAASAAAEPPLEPPGTRLVSCGLRQVPNHGIVGGRAPRQLVRRQLGDGEGAGGGQAGDARRRRARARCPARWRCRRWCGCRRSRSDPSSPPAPRPAGRDRLRRPGRIDRLGLGQGPLLGDQPHRADLAVEPGQPVEVLAAPPRRAETSTLRTSSAVSVASSHGRTWPTANRAHSAGSSRPCAEVGRQPAQQRAELERVAAVAAENHDPIHPVENEITVGGHGVQA